MTRLSENNFQLSFPNYTVIVFTLYLKYKKYTEARPTYQDSRQNNRTLGEKICNL